MSLLVVGSVAFDSIRTPHGQADEILGGAATYFSVAASWFAPVRVGGNIKQPTKVKDVKPVYPPIAQSARVQGVVIIEATIGPDGKGISLEYAALGSDGDLLEQLRPALRLLGVGSGLGVLDLGPSIVARHARRFNTFPTAVHQPGVRGFCPSYCERADYLSAVHGRVHDAVTDDPP